MNTILIVMVLWSDVTCITYVPNQGDITLDKVQSLLKSVDVFNASALDDNLADLLFNKVYKQVELQKGISVTVQCNK